VHLDGDAWFSTSSYSPPVTGTGFEPGSNHFLEFILSDGTVAASASVTLIDDNCDEAVENCTGTVGYINNGLCTTSNNNADCDWDGGDCCASTNSMSSGVEGDDGNNCAYGDPYYGEDFYCDCGDPDACENFAASDPDFCGSLIPDGWACSDSWYGDGGCDCDCGVQDADCADSDTSWACSSGQTCELGVCTDDEDDSNASSCFYDYTGSGAANCDAAYGSFGLDCTTLATDYGWDCAGCDCANDAALDGCLFDYTNSGAADCDAAYGAYGLDCTALHNDYGWNCTGCACANDVFSTGDGDIVDGDIVDGISNEETLVPEGLWHLPSKHDMLLDEDSIEIHELEFNQIITDADKKMRNNSGSEYRTAEGFKVYSDDGSGMSLVAAVYGTFYQVAGDEDGCYAVSAFDTSPAYESVLSNEACVAADPCPLSGDTNGDGYVNVTDIVSVVNIIMGGTGYEICADLNEDGNINVGDIVQIVNIILGSARAEGATEAIITVGDNLSVEGNGFIQGAQFTLTHNSPITVELADEYVAYYQTDDMTTTLVVATDGSHSLTDIATISGEYEIAEAIVVNANDQVTTQEVLEVTSFELKAAYPNPFNPVTSMQLAVPQDGFVSVKIYNLVGQEVATLANGMMQGSATPYTLRWDASAMASGVYLVQAQGAGQVSTQKLMLLK